MMYSHCTMIFFSKYYQFTTQEASKRYFLTEPENLSNHFRVHNLKFWVDKINKSIEIMKNMLFNHRTMIFQLTKVFIYYSRNYIFSIFFLHLRNLSN